MEKARVTVTDQDGQVHVADVNAASLFDAASQAAHGWSMLWWWELDLILTVEVAGRAYRVSAERVRQWQAQGPRR